MHNHLLKLAGILFFVVICMTIFGRSVFSENFDNSSAASSSDTSGAGNAQVTQSGSTFSDTVNYKVMDYPSLKLTVSASTDTTANPPKLTGTVTLQEFEDTPMSWKIVGLNGATIDAENDCSSIHVTPNLSYEPAMITTILKNGNKTVNPIELLKSTWCRQNSSSSGSTSGSSVPSGVSSGEGAQYEVIMRVQ